LIRAIQDQTQRVKAVKAELTKLLGNHAEVAIAFFTPKEEEEQPTIDKTLPTILLTSYKGCKGLSAGHVFIVGVHNGSIPKDAGDIKDVEISQFIVALTRTRKQCHIVSNDWLVAPVDRDGKYIPRFESSPFVRWIPKNLVEDRGKLAAKDLK
jgi:superfamily I DNA/RNA helicase